MLHGRNGFKRLLRLLISSLLVNVKGDYSSGPNLLTELKSNEFSLAESFRSQRYSECEKDLVYHCCPEDGEGQVRRNVGASGSKEQPFPNHQKLVPQT